MDEPPVTVVRALILHRGHVLLLRRAGRGGWSGHWEPPGGKALPGEAVDHALGRELEEETGLSRHGASRLVGGALRRTPRGQRIRELLFCVEARGPVRLSEAHDWALWHQLGTPLPGPLSEAGRAALAAASTPTPAALAA